MRKALGLLILLLVLCTSSVVWCALTVYLPHDQVQFTQTVLAGDPATAEGLTVQTYATYQNHLFWDSMTQIQNSVPQTKTDYRFYQSEQSEVGDPSYRGVEIFSDVGTGASNYMDIPENQRSGLELAYQELYESAVPGQEATKTIMLSDYCDYYPIAGFIDVEGINLAFNVWSENSTEEMAVSNKMESFFRIPVLSTEQTTISLEKDSSGYIYSTGLSNNGEGDQFSFYSQGIITPKTCYFTFNNHSNNGQIMDTSLIPGGYGIYALDYAGGQVKQLREGVTQTIENGSLQLDSLRMAFPIDPNEEFIQLSQWENDKFMLLYTRMKNTYYLTVISIDTMQQVQRLAIQTTESESYNIIENQDFIVTLLDHTVTVLLPNGDGTFHIGMQTTNTLDYSYVPWSLDGNAMDYKNGKLAFAFDGYNQETGFRDSVSYEMVVLDETGLQFWSKHQSTLHNNHLENYNTNEAVRLIYRSPIKVSWQ